MARSITRLLPVLVALAALLAGGLVHGLWNDRWQPSEAVEAAAARLDGLPTEVGGWTSEPLEQDPEALALAGAANHYSRRFLDPKTGERVAVVVLCGKPARVVVHRPEHCYRSAGYELTAPPERITVRPGGHGPAELWAGLFVRPDTSAPDQLRIFWSWLAGDRWEAPDSPRLRFARRRALYKLYVIRAVSGPSGPLADDPAARLLGLLLPVFDRTLADR